MILSKLRLSLLSVFASALMFQACGAPPNNQNNPANAQPPEAKSAFPFSTKEPEIYQADFFAGSSEYQNHWFVAKKGDRWRIDFFKNNALEWSELKTDKLYLVDHTRKIYAPEPQDGSPNVEASYFTTLLSGFFKGKESKEFIELGQEGGLRKYKVRPDAHSKDETILYVDEASGFIVKQEFTAQNVLDGTASTAKYSYELKNLRLDVDDTVLQIPAGYRQVTWDEYTLAPKVK
jgi:hypothetical protein